MKLWVDSAAAWGLQRYVRLVTEALGLAEDAACADLRTPVDAYVGLTEHIPAYPDREAALLWDECNGWAGAVESTSEDDLIVLAYFGHDVLPTPRLVTHFARELLNGHIPGQRTAPGFRSTASADDLALRLAAYASAEQLIKARR